MPALKLFLLGPPRVELDGRELPLTLRRGLALLIFVALAERPHRRDELSALLWPDTDEREGRTRLRRTLHRTSELAGEALFDSESDTIRIASNLELWVDARALEQGLSLDALQRAELPALRALAHLQQGDFLAGFTVEDSPIWEEWQFLERERLRQMASRLLRIVAEAELNVGEWDAGLDTARRWLAMDPVHEPAHRLLMQLYALSGQSAAAVRQYQQCVRVLQAELDVAPEPETEDLYERIRTKRFPAASSPAPESGSETPVPTSERVSPPVDSRTSTYSPAAVPGAALTGLLPHGLSRFVGRAAERAAAQAQMDQSSLLTLTGPGGIGKTRLALELAGAAADREVRLVELAPVSDPERVAVAVATALQIADAAGQPMIDTLVRALRARHVLIVLDNCEHLVEACASLVDSLIRHCPGVSVLATSREPLGLSWERIWPVSPLSVPEGPVTTEDVVGTESVQLLLDRARMLRPSFTLGDGNAAEIAEICRRLDGMPLAIELAAARLRILSPRQILERLDDRFHLLTGGGRAVPARQQTLEATIDWSHQLLSLEEQILFRRLAAFAGGWTLESVEEVCSGAPLPPGDVLDLLASLVDKSLVTTDMRESEPRYRYLDTIRAFAIDRLKESGEEHSVRRRFQKWSFRLLHEARFPLWGPDQDAWFHRLDLEIDNVRAALDQCETDHSSVSEALGHCTFSIFRYWDVRGGVSEARARLSGLLALAPADAPPEGVGQTRAFHAYFLMLSGRADESRAEVIAAEEQVRATDDLEALMNTLNLSLMTHGLLHDFGPFERICREGLALSDRIQHPFCHAPWFHALGLLAYMGGQFDEGERLLELSRIATEKLGSARELNYLMFHIGHLALVRGDLPGARATLDEVLRRRVAIEDALVLPQSLESMGWVARAEGDLERTARLQGAAEAGAEAVGVILMPLWKADREQTRAQARAALGEARYEQLLDEGGALSLEQAVQLALAPTGPSSSS